MPTVRRLEWLSAARLDSKVNGGIRMKLSEAVEGKEYIIRQIDTDDEEMNSFLFSLGCYSGENITVISHIRGGCIVAIKDARYNFDNQLAGAIVV